MEGGAPEEASAKRGPVAAANDPFVDMEDVLEKLKILDYEQHFCETACVEPASTRFSGRMKPALGGISSGNVG